MHLKDSDPSAKLLNSCSNTVIQTGLIQGERVKSPSTYNKPGNQSPLVPHSEDLLPQKWERGIGIGWFRLPLDIIIYHSGVFV